MTDLAPEVRRVEVSRKDTHTPRALYNRELRVCDSDMMKLWRKATRLKISANATCCSWTECFISAKTSLRPATVTKEIKDSKVSGCRNVRVPKARHPFNRVQ